MLRSLLIDMRSSYIAPQGLRPLFSDGHFGTAEGRALKQDGSSFARMSHPCRDETAS